MKQSNKRSWGSLLFILGASMFFLVPEQNDLDLDDQESTQYPRMWNSLGLPNIPGARITKIESPSEGEYDFQIDLESEQSVRDISHFFEDAFANGKFETQPQLYGFTQGYSKQFQSKDVGVAIAAEPNPKNPTGSKIVIAIRGGPQNLTRAYNSAAKVE